MQNIKSTINNYLLSFLNDIFVDEFGGNFISIKKSINVNNYEHSTVTLVKNFQNPEMVANIYVHFGYVSQRVFSHTRGKVLLSRNSDLTNTNKTANNQLFLNE